MAILANLVHSSNVSSNDPNDPIVLSDQTFQDAIKSGITFVDFWADWCTPCKIIEPVIKEIAHEWGNKVKFAKMNVDENPLIPGQYGIMSLPTFYILVNGEKKAELIGAAPKEVFIDFIKTNYEKYSVNASSTN